ncbi:hypothetical protein FPV67DRAFT_1409600 [Lyophyllum atratum]|nr:hypothetical protein FPV67DRAFT_1409600 [Lyophyllum atratum]
MPMVIDTAELAGLVIEGCLYGIFATLIVVAAYGFVRTGGKSGTMGLTSNTWPMALAGGLLVVLCTTRLAIDTANVFVAFIRHPTRATRIAYLTDVRQPLFTTKHSLLVGVLFVGDSFVNWRCWVVWGKRLWIVIIPIILSLTSAVSGSYTMWAYAHLPAQEILSELRWLTSFYVLSLVANAMSTGLLAFRIYTVRKQASRIQPSTTTLANGTRASRAGRRSLKPVLKIILESGVLNAAYLFVYTICLVTKSQGLEVMSEMACPLTGIIFVIVIIRVGLHSRPDTYWPSSRTQTVAGSGGTQPTAAESHVVFMPTGLKKPGMNGVSITTDTTTYDDVGLESRRGGDVEMGTFRAGDDARYFGDKKEAPL